MATSKSVVNNAFLAAGLRYKVLYEYVATFKQELSLEAGEIIVAYGEDKHGWMSGEKMLTGKQGVFPAVYVEITNQVKHEGILLIFNLSSKPNMIY